MWFPPRKGMGTQHFHLPLLPPEGLAHPGSALGTECCLAALTSQALCWGAAFSVPLVMHRGAGVDVQASQSAGGRVWEAWLPREAR